MTFGPAQQPNTNTEPRDGGTNPNGPPVPDDLIDQATRSYQISQAAREQERQEQLAKEKAEAEAIAEARRPQQLRDLKASFKTRHFGRGSLHENQPVSEYGQYPIVRR